MSAQNPTYPEYPEELLDIENVRYVDADTDNRIMAKLPPIVYAERSGVPLHIELVIPEKHEDFLPLYDENGGVNDIMFPTEPDGSRGKPFPLIVYVQGSGWMKQNLGFRIPMLSKFVREGYAMAFVEYRSAEILPFPAQVHDLKTAIRFLKQNAGIYNLDPERIVLWGDSSGAHTAVLAAVTDGVPGMDADEPSEFDCSVRGVIDFYGPTAVELFNEKMASILLGVPSLDGHLEEAKRANPCYYIEKGKNYPPFLIMHGTKDRLVSQTQSKLLYDKMLECGVKADFYSVRGGDHGRAEFWCDAVCGVVRSYLEAWL